MLFARVSGGMNENSNINSKNDNDNDGQWSRVDSAAAATATILNYVQPDSCIYTLHTFTNVQNFTAYRSSILDITTVLYIHYNDLLYIIHTM